MTTTFDSRAALEEAIKSCSYSVRVLQEKMHNKNDAVEIEDVAKEVQRLMGLRKELQSWTSREEADEADNQQEMETPETKITDVELEVTDNKLEQRAVELKGRVAQADEKLTMLEMEVTQIERTKKALAYLEQHETVKAIVLETGVEHTMEAVVKKSSKKNKKKNKKVKKEKVDVVETAVNTDPEVTLTIQLEAERMKVLEATKTAEKLQNLINVLTEEKRKAVADSEAEHNKAEQSSRSKQDAWTAEQGLRDIVAKLEQKIATVTQEKTELVAKLTLELEKERFKVNQSSQSDQMAESELKNTIAKLAKEKVELGKKFQAAENSTKTVRKEMEKLQGELSEIKNEKETRETHLGKLWKNIEDLQLANKVLKEKNVSIKANAKAMRADVEKTIAEHSSYGDKTKMLNAEIESAKAELETSKIEVEKLQANAELLQNEVSVSKSEVASFEMRIQTLEKELEVAKTTALKGSSEYDNLCKLNKVAEAMSATSSERTQTLEKEIKFLKQNSQELSAECDALRNSTKDAERTHKREVEKLTSQISQQQSAAEGKGEKLAAKLKKAQESAKIAIAEKETVTRQLFEMKDNVVQLKLENENALCQASKNGLQLKKLTVDLETRTAEVKKVKALYDDLISERSNAANQLQDLRGIAATNEELLKKARASLLEANEELKEARVNALKWKNSALAAKTLMNAKIADFESASKQLKKARADASSVSAARSQLSLSLQAKEKRLVKTMQELAAVRLKLTEALATMEIERTQLKQEHTEHVARLCKHSNLKVTQLDSEILLYRLMLAILLLILVAVFV